MSPRMHGVAVAVGVAVRVAVGVTVRVAVGVAVSVGRSVGEGTLTGPQAKVVGVGKAKPTVISKLTRQPPVCWMPSRKRTSTLAPGASGVASVTVSADMLELNPPPFGWL